MHAWVAISFSVIVQLGPMPAGAHDANGLEIAQLRDSVVAAELRFFRQWQDAWEASEAERHAIERRAPVPDASWNLREMLAMCSLNIPASRGRYAEAIRGRGIANYGSTHNYGSAHGVCPSWYLGDGAPPRDERYGVDNALSWHLRSGVKLARQSVLLL